MGRRRHVLLGLGLLLGVIFAWSVWTGHPEAVPWSLFVILLMLFVGPAVGFSNYPSDPANATWIGVGYCLMLLAAVALVAGGTIRFSTRWGKVALCLGSLIWACAGLLGMRYVVG